MGVGWDGLAAPACTNSCEYKKNQRMSLGDAPAGTDYRIMLFFGDRRNQLLVFVALAVLTVMIWTVQELDNSYATMIIIAAGFGIVSAVGSWPSVQEDD